VLIYIATARGSGNLWTTEQVKLSRPTEELVSEPTNLLMKLPVHIVFSLPTNNYSDVVYFSLAKL